MKVGSLFTGYGGLDMATEAAFGATTAWVSEIDKGACKILAHRYPDVPNLGDITSIDWSTVEPVDIITGGSPCQDLSHAGRRAGMTEGTRSNLWVAMREAIAQLRPRHVVWENVRGAFSAAADSDLEPCPGCVGDATGTHLRALGRVLGDLSDLGYDTQWRGLRASDVGAPHGRFRVFVVATDTQSNAGRVEHGDGGPAADARRVSREVPTPRRHAAVEVPASDGHSGRAGLRLLPSPRTSDTNGAGEHGDGGLDLRTAITLLPTPEASRAGGTPEMHLARKPGRTMCTNLDVLAGGESTNWGVYAAAISRWESLTRPAPSPTQTGKRGTPQLAAAFSEWLMGLPPGWITDVPGITRNEALKAGGNGVVPQQAYAAITHMLNQEVAA